MKKKIALLLAVIMTLSLMPITVFAGSENYLAKGTLSLKKDTKYDGTTEAIPNGLVIEFKDDIPYSATGQKFRIELTNAEFSNLYDSSVSTTASYFKAEATSYTGTPFTTNAAWDTTTGGIISSSTSSVTASAIVDGLANQATVTVYAAKKSDKITILLPMKTANVDNADVSVAITANNSFVSVGTYLISRTATSATTTVANSIKSGRDLITLDSIVIKESFIGSLSELAATRQAFELIAPSGYEFVGKGAGVTAAGSGQYAGMQLSQFDVKGTNADTSLLIGLTTSAAVSSSTILPESIIVKNVKIAPIDNDSIPFNTTLQMGIFKYQGNIKSVSFMPLNGLTEQYFDVAKAVDWTVSVTAETAKDVVTGRFDTRTDAAQQVAAKVYFKENTAGTWLAERTTEFTVPEGVIIRDIKFDTAAWKNMRQNVATGGTSLQEIDKDKWSMTAAAKTSSDSNGTVTVDRNMLSFKGFKTDPGAAGTSKAELAFTLYLSVSPEYEGDTIALSTGGTAIQQETPDVVIANVIKPITVSVSKIADVQIGFQKYSVGDIIIKENMAGAILRNADTSFGGQGGDSAANVTEATNKKGLALSIEDYISAANNDIILVPIVQSQVTVDGDLKVTLRKASSSSNSIFFDVDRQSSKPSTITIKDVEVKINRTVPYGVYDLVVAGQSVFANQATATQINSLFDVPGYSTPYINVATEGMNSPLKSNVKIAKDSDVVIVDGVQQQMMYPTYFDNSQSSFLVPARFISQIFGVEDNNIFWNDTTKTVSIITANRTLQFTAGSDLMVVAANGAPSSVTMTAKAILHPVTERLYVPFRAIGNAFGVTVSYDETTGMAEYNQAK